MEVRRKTPQSIKDGRHETKCQYWIQHPTKESRQRQHERRRRWNSYNGNGTFEATATAAPSFTSIAPIVAAAQQQAPYTICNPKIKPW